MHSMICPILSCSKVVDIHTVIQMGGICPMCYADIREEVEIWYPTTANRSGPLSFESDAAGGSPC